MSNAKNNTDLASRYSSRDEKNDLMEDLPIIDSNPHIHKRGTTSKLRFRLSVVILLACGISLISLLRDFVQTSDWEDEESTPEFFQLVKNVCRFQVPPQKLKRA